MEVSQNKFQEFYKYSQAEFEEKIANELKTKTLESYSKNIGDLIEINPLKINHSVTQTNLSIRNNQNWFISEYIPSNNYKSINKNILKALEGGTNAISLEIYEQWSVQQFEIAFENVHLGYIFTHFSFKNKSVEIHKFLEIFNIYLKKIGLDSRQILGSIEAFDQLVNITIETEFLLFKSRLFKEDEKSDSIIQLADLLIDAEYLLSENLENSTQKKVAGSIFFKLNLSDNIYQNIAKIRALQILWFTILENYNLEKTIFIKTIIKQNEAENENTAIIVSTTKAISAIIGGVNLIEIEPFVHKNATEDPSFSSRIARNIQNLLSIESHFGYVSDPMNGSYYIENLTQQIIEKVWDIFQKNTK